MTAYEVVYDKMNGTKMNDLDLCLEVVEGHVNHCGVNHRNYLSYILRDRFQRERLGTAFPKLF